MNINYINTYNNVSSPKVEGEIDAYTFLETISNPNSEILDKIHNARYYYSNGNKEAYESIKLSLNCYTLNFSFNGYKKNDNIKGSTGLMYIDLDGNTNINLSNKYIFASWKSLSNNGRGILVRVEGLNLNNFKHNYTVVSSLLGIKADNNAAKPTQFNIQSYDKDLYVNDSSLVFKAQSVTSNPIIINKKEHNDSTKCNTFNNIKIRYNTIDEYNFDDKDYIFFPYEKEDYYEIYIPKIIVKGKRNNIVFAIGSQYKGLNKSIRFKKLKSFLDRVNTHCEPPLEEAEVKKITRSIMSNENIEPMRKTPRRILFAPNSKLTKAEKIGVSNKLNGERRSKETQKEIIKTIKNWDQETDGKMTNTAIAKKIGINRATVGRQLRRIDLLSG